MYRRYRTTPARARCRDAEMRRGRPQDRALTHAYWGPEYSNDEIRNTLDKIGARYEALEDPVSCCVQPISSNKRRSAGFQAAMEYGPPCARQPF